ncbi:hypothetical protein P261_00491 [Lachnospiraceae bacterium TWA4]|nr:hypothetical protein P261_00491 [Lachnospiraceae bacterium TWA4]
MFGRAHKKELADDEDIEQFQEDLQKELEEELQEELQEEIDNEPVLEALEIKDEKPKKSKKPKKQKKSKKLKEEVKKQDKIISQLKEVYNFINQPFVKKFIKKSTSRIKHLFKRLKPKKLELTIHFGLDDPEIVGGILAVTSMLYPIYYGHIFLEPEFEEVVLEGKFYLKGKLRMIHFVSFFVKTSISILLDKQIRTLIFSKIRR